MKFSVKYDNPVKTLRKSPVWFRYCWFLCFWNQGFPKMRKNWFMGFRVLGLSVHFKGDLSPV